MGVVNRVWVKSMGMVVRRYIDFLTLAIIILSSINSNPWYLI